MVVCARTGISTPSAAADSIGKLMEDEAIAANRLCSTLWMADILPKMLQGSERLNPLVFDHAPSHNNAESVKEYIPTGSPVFDIGENNNFAEIIHSRPATHPQGWPRFCKAVKSRKLFGVCWRKRGAKDASGSPEW